MENETFSMYSNKFSIFLNPSEAILTFLENQPRYNEKDEVIGMDTTNKSTIFLSLGAFKNFLEAANNLLKQVEDDQKKDNK